VIGNAQVMAKVLKSRGLRIVSGRTESHVFLVDLQAKNITGKGRGGPGQGPHHREQECHPQ